MRHLTDVSDASDLFVSANSWVSRRRSEAVVLGVLGAVCLMAGGCRRESAPPRVQAPAPPTQADAARSGQGGAPAATGAATGEAGDAAGGPRPRNIAPIWASWPMPNPAGSGLPNAASYRTDSNEVVVDTVTGLMWQRAVDPRSFAWRSAVDYCDKLTLAGHDDWRLPSRIELVSIIDVTRAEPAINPLAFPHTPSDWFWSSSTESVNPDGAAWHVYFFFGTPKSDPTNTPYRARCVRTGEPREATGAGVAAAGGTGAVVPFGLAPPPYDVQKDVVRDRGTGLTWQRAVPGKAISFEGARRYCAGLRLDKTKGWRVPTMGELLTLVDERTTGPMIDAQAFPATPNKSFWTSSFSAGSKEMAWHVYFEYGNANYGLLNEPYLVRCVR